jgi:hypothetical protein
MKPQHVLPGSYRPSRADAGSCAARHGPALQLSSEIDSAGPAQGVDKHNELFDARQCTQLHEAADLQVTAEKVQSMPYQCSPGCKQVHCAAQVQQSASVSSHSGEKVEHMALPSGVQWKSCYPHLVRDSFPRRMTGLATENSMEKELFRKFTPDADRVFEDRLKCALSCSECFILLLHSHDVVAVCNCSLHRVITSCS